MAVCGCSFQFNDMMGDLMGWLSDAERLLTSEYHVGNDPAKIKGQIAKHKVCMVDFGWLTHCSRGDFSTLIYWKSPFAA